MTTVQPAQQLELAPSEIEDASERAFDESPCWPVTRLVSWALTGLLGAGIFAGSVLPSHLRGEWVALMIPAAMSTLSARALFEALDFQVEQHRGFRHALSAIPPAAVAVTLMALASLILGSSWSPFAGGVTASVSVVTLTVGGMARDVEVRLRRSLRRVYAVCARASVHDLTRELARRRDARLVGAADADAPPAADLVEQVLASRATVLVLDSVAMRVPELVDAASRLNLAGLRIRDLVSYYESEFKKVPLGELTPTWFLFDIAAIHRRWRYQAVRRMIDVVVASAGFVVSMPLQVAAILAIRLTGGGPIFYVQRRAGRGGVEFDLLKLRTMIPSSGGEAAWATSQAGRVTRVGRVLRRFRLDELPQLWNVIRGDLALIGPRPEQVSIVERLDRQLPHYSARHCIRPGLTGWAQVNLGYGGSLEGTIAKLQRDLYYVKHSSFRLDLLILWLTVKAVIAGRG